MKRLLPLLLFLTAASLHADDPRPEYRAYWVDTFRTPFATRVDVDRIVDAAVESNANALFVQVRRRGDEAPGRVGFTVARKVGTAVERNRVRRRLKEVVRLAAATGLPTGNDYVLVGRRAALSLPFEQILNDFTRALGRLRVAT